MHLTVPVQATPGLHQGTAQTHDHHPRPRASDHLVEARRGQQSRLTRTHHITSVQQRLAVADVASQGTDMIARPDSVVDGDGVAMHVGAVQRDDGISTTRDRLSCTDAYTSAHLHLAGARLPDSQGAAGGFAATLHILSPQRVAIELGAIKCGQVHGRLDVLAQGQPPGVQQVHAIGAKRVDEAEHVVAVVGHRTQATRVAGGWLRQPRFLDRLRDFHLRNRLPSSKQTHALYPRRVTPDASGRLSQPSATAAAKRQLRCQQLARRAERSPRERAALDEQRSAALLQWIQARQPSVVACYLSRPPEPDTGELVDALLAGGIRVLVPVLAAAPMRDNRLLPSWAWYQGRDQLTVGTFGIPEPRADPLPADTLLEADLVLVSALAVGRDGSRLGMGSGWFDEALTHARPDACVVAVLFGEDVLPTVPVDVHDRRVDAIATEAGVTLPAG